MGRFGVAIVNDLSMPGSFPRVGWLIRHPCPVLMQRLREAVIVPVLVDRLNCRHWNVIQARIVKDLEASDSACPSASLSYCSAYIQI